MGQPGIKPLQQVWTSAAFAIFLLGLAASAFFFHITSEGWRNAAQQELEALGTERSEVLNLRLLRAVDGLRAVGALFTVGENVSRLQFQGYGSDMLQWLPEIDRLQWQPLVSLEERASYEATARMDGLVDFEFVEPGPGGKPVRAREREMHLPVYYEIARLTQGRRGSELGFDAAANLAQMEYKWLAADTGQATTFIPYRPKGTLTPSSPAGRAQDGFGGQGAVEVANDSNVILSLPVYRRQCCVNAAERRQYLRGFVVADLRLNELVQGVISGLPGQGVDVLLYLHTHRHNELVYRRLAKNSDIVVAQGRDLDFVRMLDVAGRQWLLLLHPTPAYLADRQTRQPELLLIIGVLLSCTFAGHLYNSQRQRQRIEQANADLLESQNRFSLFMDHHPGIAFIKDAEGRLVFVNQTLADALGFSASDAWRGRNDLHLWPEDAVEACRRCDQYVLQANLPMVVEEPVWRHGRNETWLVIKFPFTDLQGNRYLGGFATDITARKQTEEQLRLSARVFENAAEAVVISDADNTIITVNPAFGQITGYRRDEVVGRNPKMLSSGQHSAPFYQRLWQALRETGCWQGEIWNRRKSGEVYVEWLSISVVRDDADRVSHYIGIFSDITERKEAEDRIRFLAHYDDLTQLPNRSLTRDRLRQAVLAASRTGERVSVLFLDLDRFKVINDSLGHHVGDVLLQEVGQRVRDCLREVDTVGRLGGDEFLVVLPDTDADGAARVARKILERMAVTFVIEGHSLSNSLSIGIAVYPTDGSDIAALMKNADAAMYQAKQAGRGSYQLFSIEMNEAAHEQLCLENGLRQALEKGQLSLHYQPKVDLKERRVVGCEALMRWIHPELGMVSPVRFIPVAEDCGLIVTLGEWAMREACRQMLEFQRCSGQPLSVAVNVSALQFNQPTFVATVRRVLEETGLEAKYLELELTESALMKDAANVIAILEELGAMGIKLSIDDFGTGYSSLGYLKRFPIHCLKIDQSFVRDLEIDGDDAAIVNAIISLAHSLRLTVIAEGVEMAGQLLFLLDRGCEEAQGFYFDKPLPAAAFQHLLLHLPLPAAD